MLRAVVRRSLRSAARRSLRSAPPWLVHPLRWQRAPVPWPAVGRGALSAGPLLAVALATGHPGAGVLAGIGAMLAGVNDRPGTRRKGAAHIGLPALAGASGLLAGALLDAVAPTSWWAVPLLFAVGLLSGAVSVSGPVWSAAGMQMLVATAVGAGMPMPGSPWFKALCFLGGACWLMLLRLVLRPPRPWGGALDGERAAIAAVFDALADALDAVGGPGAEGARRRLTAALDRADEALRLRRLLRVPVLRLRALRGGRRVGVPRVRARSTTASAQERLLAERFAAATALCEASVALLWEAHALPARIADGPRRLAAAMRTGEPPGPLPAPVPETTARSSFDRALLDAAVVFGRTEPRDGPAEEAGHPHPHALGAFTGKGRGRHRRGVFGAAGRAYGLRVAVCVSASTVAALLLGTEHWFWLPATAAFLVKPDMGPLFSRVVNRVAGTAVGVLLFAGLTAVAEGPWWPVVVAGAAGALIPVATRHFALQTTVVTLMVLAFLFTAGDTQAAAPRLTHTAIASGIVLLAGHLPRLLAPGTHVGPRFAAALRRTEDYVRHVLAVRPAPVAAPGEPVRRAEGSEERMALRRAAYRALGEARAMAEMAASEFPSRRGPTRDWLAAMAMAERVVDAATACAVRLEHGAPRPGRANADRITDALAEAAKDADRRVGRASALRSAAAGEREALAHVVTRLHHVGEVTPAA
ncbi:FUSC family protein [Streptomyces daliensis]